MRPFLHIPPPILHFARWLLAVLASFFHFGHGIAIFASAPLPLPVVGSLESVSIVTWGGLAEWLPWVLVRGLDQLKHAIVNHPDSFVIALWWLIETCILIVAARDWCKRWRTRRSNSHSCAQ